MNKLLSIPPSEPVLSGVEVGVRGLKILLHQTN